MSQFQQTGPIEGMTTIGGNTQLINVNDNSGESGDSGGGMPLGLSADVVYGLMAVALVWWWLKKGK